MTAPFFGKAAACMVGVSALYGAGFYWSSSQQQRLHSVAVSLQRQAGPGGSSSLHSSPCQESKAEGNPPQGGGAPSERGGGVAALPSAIDGVSEEDHVRGFRDANAFLSNKTWLVETSNFNNHAKGYGDKPPTTKPLKRLPVPAVEVLKLRSLHYDEYELYEGTVPVLRIIGYFPNVTPRAVCEQLGDTEARLKWDANYRLFERLMSLPQGPSVLERLPSKGLLNPTMANASEDADGQHQAIRRRLLRGLGAGLSGATARQFSAADPPGGVVEDRAILTHRVASKGLERVGVAGRFFCYERVIRRYDIPFAFASSQPGARSTSTAKATSGADAGSREAFSLVYRSLPSSVMHQLVASLSPPDRRPKPTDVPVFMHSQEILLLPVSYENSNPLTTERGLVELAVHRLRDVAGVSDKDSNDKISAFLEGNQTARATKRRSRGGTGGAAESGDGVLMIMTSVNDGKMPRGLPRVAERMVAQYFTTATYTNLQQAAATAGEQGKNPPG